MFSNYLFFLAVAILQVLTIPAKAKQQNTADLLTV